MKATEFGRAYPGPAFERTYEVGRIGVTKPPPNLSQRHIRIWQKLLRLPESDCLKQTRKRCIVFGEATLQRTSGCSYCRCDELHTHFRAPERGLDNLL